MDIHHFQTLESWHHSVCFDVKAIIFIEMISKPAVTIRNLSDETHYALRLRAAHHGRSIEAEIRDIIEAAVHPLNVLSSALYWRLSAAMLNFPGATLKPCRKIATRRLLNP